MDAAMRPHSGSLKHWHCMTLSRPAWLSVLHLFIQFLLLSAGEFLPRARRFNTGLEAMQQMAHLFQRKPQACASRSTPPLNSVRRYRL